MTHPALKTVTALTTALILLAGPAPALAQTVAPTTESATESAAQAAALQARGETYHRAPDTAQDPDELAATARLNAMIVAHNEAAERQEAESTAAYDAAQARYRADAATAATLQANYEANQRTAAAARAEYERARATWEGLIRACEASGRRDCRANAPD